MPLTAGGDEMDGKRGKRPIHRLCPGTLDGGLGERRHPAIGPLGSRDQSMRGSELVVTPSGAGSSHRLDEPTTRVVVSWKFSKTRDLIWT